MNVVLIIAILVLFAGIGFIIYDRFKNKDKYEKVIVCFSEKIGNKVIENDSQYIGLIHRLHDLFKVPTLHINLPIPPNKVYVHTKNGKKKIYLIKIDSFRYGFRIPSMDNEVYIQDRDIAGNPIKIANKPLLKKHKWNYCDDVVEPDVKHWEENIMEKLKQKHRTRNDILSKWIAPILVGLILVSGIVTIHLTTKYAGETMDTVAKINGETVEKAKENTGMIQNIIKKIDNDEKKAGGT